MPSSTTARMTRAVIALVLAITGLGAAAIAVAGPASAMGPTTMVTLTAPPTATAGMPVSVTITATDLTMMPATGTVTLTSASDSKATFNPASVPITNGTGTAMVTFGTSGSQTLKAADSVNPAAMSTATVVVSPGAATTLTVTATATATAGTPVASTMVTAKDANGNTATGYTGTIHFTSATDPAATFPADYTFTAADAGTKSFPNGVTFKTAGTQTVTATDTVTNTIKGTSGSVVVSPGAVTKLSVAAPATAAKGAAVPVVVTAKDANGNTVSTYTGTVKITSSDAAATLPADHAYVAGDNGTFTFMVTFNTVGSQTVTATDKTTATITGVSSGTTVTPAAATQLTVALSPTSTTAGGPVSVTVTAKDSTGAVATTYGSTIHFTSTDPAATLPGDYTFVPGDNGTHVFPNGVVFSTTGSQMVTAAQTPTVTPSVTGTSNPVTVSAPAPATKFAVTAPTTATKGSAIMVTVQAKDANNANTSAFTGMVHVSSSDAASTLPADFMVNGGLATFPVTYNTAGPQTVTVTSTTGATPAITGMSNTTTVGVSPVADHFLVTAPTSAVAGTAVSVTVTAKDSSNATVTGYLGTVKLTSSDAMAVLPANYTFLATDMGTKTFTVTFKTSGSQTVTATDTTTTTVIGTSAAVAVAAGAVTKLGVTAPATATAGTAVSVVVKAQDAFNNTVTGYVGTVHVTSTDTAATLPADYTFTAADMGSHTLMVTFKTAGSRTVTATDTVTSSITGTSGTVTVSPSTLATTTQVGSNPALLKALVTATPATAGGTTPTPTGMVAFTVNGASVGSATLDSSGVATLTYTLKPGTQKIVATYAGTDGFTTSNGTRTVTGPKVTPTLTSSSPKSSYGWYHTNVAVTYGCSAGTAAVVSCPGRTVLSQEGKKVTVTKTVVDKDGGRTVVTTTVMIDKTKPTLTVGGVQNGHTYAHAPHLTCKASDSLSGVASCTIAKQRDGKTVSYTATALDKAGNRTVVKGTYKLK